MISDEEYIRTLIKKIYPPPPKLLGFGIDPWIFRWYASKTKAINKINKRSKI